MVDRDSPPTDSELGLLQSLGVTVIAGYIGGPNRNPNYWSYADVTRCQSAGFVWQPIYVGQNYCPDCWTPDLSWSSGTNDGVDAFSLARQFGAMSGLLILDLEYDTYWSYSQSGTLDYVSGWAAQVASEGYYPVIYGPGGMISAWKPPVPAGYWLADWDNVGDLSQWPVPGKYGVIGWQYSDRWYGFDVSHVDDNWLQSGETQGPGQGQYGGYGGGGGQGQIGGGGVNWAAIPAALTQWDGIVSPTAQAFGLDPALVYAVIQNESGGDASATSPKGAEGLMQVMPDNYPGHNEYDPLTNVQDGCAILAADINQFSGDLVEALQQYNGGSYRGSDTYAYAQAVIATYEQYSLSGGGSGNSGGGGAYYPPPTSDYTPTSGGGVDQLSTAWTAFVSAVENDLPYYYGVIIGLRSAFSNGLGGTGGPQQ